MLSNRCSDILKEIINNHKPVKIKYLADIFNVSSRTVRYDLDEIDYYLKSASFKTTCRKTNVGIFFDGDDDERREVLKSIFRAKEDNVNYTSRERKLIILVKRCLNEEPSTIESISGDLGVSISTTLKDLEQLRSSFAQFGIAFRSFALSGGESEIRNAITNIFMLLLDKRTIYEIVRMISGESETILTSAYTQLFSHVGIELLQQSIRIYSKTVQTFLSNEKFLLYTVHLAVQNALGHGLMIANHGVPQYEIVQGSSTRLALTLVSSVGHMGNQDLRYRPGRRSGALCQTPDSQLQCTLVSSYRLFCLSPQTRRAQLGEQYCNPIVAKSYAEYESAGIMPDEFYALCHDGELSLKAFKQAEIGDGFVARFANPSYSAVANQRIDTPPYLFKGCHAINSSEQSVKDERIQALYTTNPDTSDPHVFNGGVTIEQPAPHTLLGLKFTT